MEGEWKVYGSGKEGDPLTPLRLLALCVLAGLLSGYLLVLTLFAFVVALVFIVVAAVFIPLSLLLPRRHTALYLFAFATGFGCLMKRKYNILVCGQILYNFPPPQLQSIVVAATRHTKRKEGVVHCLYDSIS